MTIVIGLIVALVTVCAIGALRMWLIEREMRANEDPGNP